MASNITFKTTPADYLPVYNKVECCVYEQDATSRAQSGYTYVIDIATELHGTRRFYVKPEPTLEYGFLDYSRYLERYAKEVIAPYNSTTPFNFNQDEMIIKYDIDVYSAWYVSGVFTVDPDAVGAVSVTNKYVWDASFDQHDWIYQQTLLQPFGSWLVGTAGGTDSKFLTNYPNKKARITDLGWTYILAQVAGEVDYLQVKTYDSSDTLLQTCNITNGLSTAVTASKLLSVATAPQSLNNISGGFTLGAQPIVTSSVAYYTVQVFETTPTAISELITITVDTDCRYETYRIHFLNKLGGYDAYNFTSRNLLSTDIQRKQYTRDETTIASSGITWNNEDPNGRTDYIVKYKDKVRLKSDYLTDAENTWLKELVTSPNVYLEYLDPDGTNRFKPVLITSNSWREITTEHDKLFQLEVDMEFALTDIRQRR